MAWRPINNISVIMHHRSQWSRNTMRHITPYYHSRGNSTSVESILILSCQLLIYTLYLTLKDYHTIFKMKYNTKYKYISINISQWSAQWSLGYNKLKWRICMYYHHNSIISKLTRIMESNASNCLHCSATLLC